jgi:hypothetical protein
MMERLLLFTCGSLLGRFQRIDLGFLALYFHFHMGGEIANPSLPFFFRGGIGAADLPDGAVYDPVAAFTVFNNNLTGTLGKNTPLFPPEGTFLAGKNRLTLHF